MNSAAAVQALQEYTRVGVHTEIDGASPHRLIQMLMDGALMRISKARSSLRDNDIPGKGEFISSAISIIGGLRDSLDHTAGGGIATNLDSLYEYMSKRLIVGNLTNDDAIFSEVHGLLMEIKTAWDQIEHAAAQVNEPLPEYLPKKAGGFIYG